MPRLKTIFTTALAALFAPALFALNTQTAPAPTNPAVPGTLNYIEGSANLDGQTISQHAIGSATLAPGQVLSTTDRPRRSPPHPRHLPPPRPQQRRQDGLPGHHQHRGRTCSGAAPQSKWISSSRKTTSMCWKQCSSPTCRHRPLRVQCRQRHCYGLPGQGRHRQRQRPLGHHQVRTTWSMSPQVPRPSTPQSSTSIAQEDRPLSRWSSLRSDYLAEANQQMAGRVCPWLRARLVLGSLYAQLHLPWPYAFYSPFGWGYRSLRLGWRLGSIPATTAAATTAAATTPAITEAATSATATHPARTVRCNLRNGGFGGPARVLLPQRLPRQRLPQRRSHGRLPWRRLHGWLPRWWRRRRSPRRRRLRRRPRPLISIRPNNRNPILLRWNGVSF